MVVYAVVGIFDVVGYSNSQVQKEILMISMLTEAILVSRTAAEGCTGTSVSKFAHKTLGLCVIPTLQQLTQLLIWLSLCSSNQCFQMTFQGVCGW